VGSALVDEAQLGEWGRAFARSLPRPAVVALAGDLGTGKTTLVRAMCEALGVRGSVTSPTFALVHRYDGEDTAVYHVDAYRLRSPAEARDLGFDDMLGEGAPIVFVEWPERLGDHAPAFTHRVHLAYTGEDGVRRLEWA
jgi:tRNA threonylcarbamoyladenosine biosynthesis protein TsaE